MNLKYDNNNDNNLKIQFEQNSYIAVQIVYSKLLTKGKEEHFSSALLGSLFNISVIQLKRQQFCLYYKYKLKNLKVAELKDEG